MQTSLAPAEPRTSKNLSMPAQSAVILVVEDDSALQEAIVDTLELAEFSVLAASSAEEALQLLDQQAVDMVISDVNMGAMDGHQLLAQVKRDCPLVPVLLITAYGSIERSVSAMQAGAVDYLVKPFEPGVLIELVKRYAVGQSTAGDEPIAVAASSRELLQMARRVAQTDSTVLLAGESGVGKEVLARYIHQHSARSEKPFVAINCAAIPESMLEATLFGHEKGAFTGAHQSAPGKFEQANGGTLLLDEVSEMNLSLQAKLLRVIQEREVERVGGRKTIALDIRILATTNRNLREYVDEGKFREDLFYRLSVFPLNCLALRDRRDDIVPLARHLVAVHTQKMGRHNVELTGTAASALQQYHWPGNVRELDNVVQRALILQAGNAIDSADLMFESTPLAAADTNIAAVTANAALAGVEDINQLERPGTAVLEKDLRKREYQIILDTLELARGSKKETAEKLGISPRTLRYKLAKMREEGYLVD